MAFISFASTDQFSSEKTSPILRPIILWLFPNLSEVGLMRAQLLTRKAAHFTEYGILALLVWRAFATSSRAFIRENWFKLGVVMIVVYASLDELHQSLVPSRTASIYDSGIDILGGLVILLIMKVREKRAIRSGTVRS
jgi:VanZ family protein